MSAPTIDLARSVLATALLLFGAATAHAQVTGVRNTKHNLSASSANTIRASAETEICVFCHTPHGGRTDAPLWNRSYSASNYTPYSSSSLQSAPGQPNGFSKLCLSCHDGTIAIGGVMNAPNGGAGTPLATTGTNADGTMPGGSTMLGTNLTADHPVSMVFDQPLRTDDGELVDPSTLPAGGVRLYPGTDPAIANSVQCTSCHDPHTDAQPKFLRKNPRGSDNLCVTCHTKPGWIGSVHQTSLLNAAIGGVTTSVSDHACMSCHSPHSVDGAQRLLRNGAVAGVPTIEETCFQCHRSGGPAQNIQAEFAKSARHPVADAAAAGTHKPVFIKYPASGLPENVQLNPGSPAPDPRFTDARHVECTDCHNPHRATRANRLEGMRGVALNGTIVDNPRNDSTDAGVSQQHTVCLRCHGDSYNTALPVTLASGLPPSNKKLEFQTSNSSFHPVGGPGRNASANLQAQLSPNGLGVTATIRCTDCHNSNAYATTTGKVAGVAGSPSGPHGSTNQSILRANYRNTPGVTSYSNGNFATCFRCHRETALMGASTNFNDNINGKGNLHALHLQGRVGSTGAVCKSCHYNIHSNQQAANTEYVVDNVSYATPPGATPTRLISFHPNVRGISADGTVNLARKPRWWINTATRERRCYLQCHSASGGTGGAVMNGELGDGGRRAQYRPSAGGDLPP